MVPSRELDLKETASTSHSKDFQAADSPIEYKMQCFTCGAPTDWPHDLGESSQKLSEMDCT